ncbi:zinc finger protein 444 [Echinops telfairi]|uniref:Zinc finger protein 444 n=1 Tax=Echinops telfairi TaxID=9371 RepID=A0AC55D991_ECHTE|nr:zinc finger protein 444 [Echinops telfairi]
MLSLEHRGPQKITSGTTCGPRAASLTPLPYTVTPSRHRLSGRDSAAGPEGPGTGDTQATRAYKQEPGSPPLVPLVPGLPSFPAAPGAVSCPECAFAI